MMKSGKLSLIFNISVFLLLVLGIFGGITFLTGVSDTKITEPNGMADLLDFDFSETVFLDKRCFEWYPNVYYTPEDFAAGTVTESPQYPDTDPDADYGTYRLILTLPAGQTYGLSGYSADFAQRLYINGMEYPAVGNPGTTAAENTPKTVYYTAYFTPQKEQVELVIHLSNFVHVRSTLHGYTLGEQDVITTRNDAVRMRINLIVGCMLTGFLLFIGIFLFFRKRLAFLWFSIACLAIAIRTLIVERKTIMVLFPNLDWHVSLAMEYIALGLFALMMVFFLHEMFGKVLHKAVLWTMAVLCIIFGAIIVFAPSSFYSKYAYHFLYAAAGVGIYTIVRILLQRIKQKKHQHAEHTMLLTGLGVFLATAIPDIIIYQSGGLASDITLTQVGMMVFLFLTTLALILSFFRTETELKQAKQKEAEMQQQNELLEQLNRLKSDFLSNVTHEMKTPLAVMSGYAQLTQWQMDADNLGEDSRENLQTISSEAKRLSMLVEQLLGLAAERQQVAEKELLYPEKLIQTAGALTKPILEKQENQLQIKVDSNCPAIHANHDMLVQMLINLITNANKHTQHGVIALSAIPAGDTVQITVSDTGDGIDADLLPYVFERGTSGDQSSGLGLSICRDIIALHGGTIAIESKKEHGTAVTFTLPLKGADTTDGTEKTQDPAG